MTWFGNSSPDRDYVLSAVDVARPIFESDKAGRLIDKFVLPMVG